MKINICDVCFYDNGTMTESKRRVGYTNTEKVDLCETHQDWAKQFTGRKEYIEGFMKLLQGNPEAVESK